MTAEEVEAGIVAAFAGVDRENGISWSESILIDEWVVDPKRLHDARMSDREQSWLEMVDDPEWEYDDLLGKGGFSFLDPIGYRYYLAAAMVRALRVGGLWNLGYSLDLEEGQLWEYKQWQRSLLTGSQLHAVAAFVRFMADQEEWGFGAAWRHYWKEVSEKSLAELPPDEVRKVRKEKKKRRRRPGPVRAEVLRDLEKD